jgi:hypothetical protein
MRFQAARDIKKGEQLFIDYNADTAINSGDYISAKSLISA